MPLPWLGNYQKTDSSLNPLALWKPKSNHLKWYYSSPFSPLHSRAAKDKGFLLPPSATKSNFQLLPHTGS
ncbi:hypothetical protein L6452_17250 [Arctium lappa]|uniref:Uncharacterized protein n=1 Tax=Arctium lappa TaxID=4217 RepID=A0ACB9C2R2_ARCLA|nr:hypothetical protein L6452_17250 [Arctium lappa]